MTRNMKKQIHIVLIFAFAIVGSVFFAPSTNAASTTSIPGTVGTGTGGACDDSAGANWGTTLSAYQIDDGTYGTYGGSTVDASVESEELRLTNFHFSSSIPNGSTINGIRVSIVRKGTAGADIGDLELYMSTSTTARTGSNYASTTNWYTTSDVTMLYGGSQDKWGNLSWTEADVGASGFGIIFCVGTNSGGNNETASVDDVRITVYYTEPLSALTQDGYRWRSNHKTETGTTWLIAEDTALTGANNTTASTTRLRILVDETASTATTTLYQLEYATSTSAGCSALTYVPVAGQASSTGYAWKMSPTSQFANGGATTNIADPNGLTDTTGSFRAGVTQDTAARISSGIAHAAGEFTELEWSIEGTTLTNGQSYCFRVTNADDTTNFTYSLYPKINMASTTALSQAHYRWRATNGGEGAGGRPCDF